MGSDLGLTPRKAVSDTVSDTEMQARFRTRCRLRPSSEPFSLMKGSVGHDAQQRGQRPERRGQQHGSGAVPAVVGDERRPLPGSHRVYIGVRPRSDTEHRSRSAS